MTASEARWQQYLNKKPSSQKEYNFIIGQIKNFVKGNMNSLTVKIEDTMVIAKLRHDGYNVGEVDGKAVIRW